MKIWVMITTGCESCGYPARVVARTIKPENNEATNDGAICNFTHIAEVVIDGPAVDMEDLYD